MTQPVTTARASCADAVAAELNECVYESPICPQPEPADEPNASADPPIRVGPPPGPALRFCQQADSVIEGYLCGEPTVVSNACRKPKNAFDAYVCDEPRMHALQTRVLRETYALLKALFLELIR